MINIYDVEGNILMTAEITASAKWVRELMKTNYISLSWNSAEKVILPVGAYINYTYKIDKVREVTRQFLLLEGYEPTQTDEMSWKYMPEFQHPEMILSKVPFYIFTKNSQNEDIKRYVFPFVGMLSDLAFRIKKFLNEDIKLENCGWNVMFIGIYDMNINVSFNNNDFRSALTQIANAIGNNCEWHIDYDNEIIYIGYVAINNGEGIEIMTMGGQVLPQGIGTLCSLTYKAKKSKGELWDEKTFSEIITKIK